MYYIGIDLGTSSVKLLLMEGNGRIVNVVSKSYELSFPEPGCSEQNPYDWYTQTMAGIKELVADVDSDLVAGISFGGQMHGLVMLDEKDRVIRPAILWNDGRTGEETKYLNEVIGKETLSKNTSNIAFAGFTAPKLLWVKKHEPDNFNKIAKIMLPKDYLAYRLTGVHATDMSDASGMLLLDVKNRSWSKVMCKLCGIDTESGVLPKLYESYEVIGKLKPEVAKELGLSEKVKITAGAGDNAAAAIGTGTVFNNSCNISIGTSGTLFIASDSHGVDNNNALHSFCHANGHYHLMGCMLSAATCNRWWFEDIIRNNDYDSQHKALDGFGENHVYFLPYLMGERSPHNNEDARGTFVGMTLDTRREDMSLAVLEGVAFGLRDSLEVAKSLGIRPERTCICGGGAKSPTWRWIIANVLGLKVDILENEEGPALGAAILAAVGCGEYDSVEEAAKKIVKIKETVEPDPSFVEKYNKKYEQFKQIYPIMKDVYQVIK